MKRALALAAAAACLAGPALADSKATATKEGVALTVYRAPDRAIVCLTTRKPVHLSGEYGIHASWEGPAPKAKPVELYSKQEHFAQPVRVELPLPAAARSVRVEVGACIDNESCDMVEFRTDLRRLTADASAAPATCAP